MCCGSCSQCALQGWSGFASMIQPGSLPCPEAGRPTQLEPGPSDFAREQPVPRISGLVASWPPNLVLIWPLLVSVSSQLWECRQGPGGSWRASWPDGHLPSHRADRRFRLLPFLYGGQFLFVPTSERTSEIKAFRRISHCWEG